METRNKEDNMKKACFDSGKFFVKVYGLMVQAGREEHGRQREGYESIDRDD